MFDAIQNELQYRFGTKAAREGKVQAGDDGQWNPGLVGRALGVYSRDDGDSRKYKS